MIELTFFPVELTQVTKENAAGIVNQLKINNSTKNRPKENNISRNISFNSRDQWLCKFLGKKEQGYFYINPHRIF